MIDNGMVDVGLLVFFQESGSFIMENNLSKPPLQQAVSSSDSC